MVNFNKLVCLGCVKDGYVFCTIEFKDGKLSISGVIGPKKNGDCRGSAGQIVGSFKEYDSRGYMSVEEIEPEKGWDYSLVRRFFDIWQTWHLNDMRAGCSHQRVLGWQERKIDQSKPKESYGKHFQSQQYASWNMLAWVRPDEHPEGLLGKPCPVCGYKYGSAWLKEEVPADVLDFLAGLPETLLPYPWRRN